MPRITPWLWFDTEAEEAAEFYCSIFPNSKITEVSHYPEGGPREAGLAMTVSFHINCDDQAEVDYFWEKLTAGGGEEVQCGWLKDRFGVSWQVVPAGFEDVWSSGDPARAERAMKAMMGMKKLDLAALQAAADGA